MGDTSSAEVLPSYLDLRKRYQFYSKPVNLLEGDSLQLVMLRECLPLAQIYQQCNPITGMSKTD